MITIIEYLPSHYVLFALLVFIALICVREVRKKDESVVSGVPWVGRRSRGIFLGKRASFSSLIRMQRWMADAYQIFSKRGKTYLLPNFSGKPIFIVPPTQLKWLIDQPDHILSTAAFHYDTQQGDYAFTHPQILGDPYHEHVLHKSLPRKIGNRVPDLWNEVAHSFDHVWGTDTTSWKELNLHSTIDHLVAPAVNRMIIGLPLCRHEPYLLEMHKFTMNAVTIMTVLQFTPRILTPLIGRLLAITIARRLDQTRRHTLPIITERLANFKRKQHDPNYQWQEPNDYLTWHISLAHSENRLHELNPDTIARRLLALNFAALHTTAMGSINCLLDLIASPPSSNYMSSIRSEVTLALASTSDGIWDKAALNRCHLTDSALRESLRVSNFMSRNVQKKVLHPSGIVNPFEGWTAPQGAYIAVDMHNPQHDADIYPDPETYHPFRFAPSAPTISTSAAEQPTTTTPKTEKAKGANTSVLTTSSTFLPFGHGRHACPGRFFIAVEIKLMLAYMVMKYEIEPLEQRPRNRWLGGIRLPPTETVIRVRRRERSV